jgi:hypothetical protein
MENSTFPVSGLLEQDMAQFRAMALGDSAAQLFVPVVLAAGPSGQPARPVRLLVNQMLVRTDSGWRIASILPIPAPAQ